MLTSCVVTYIHILPFVSFELLILYVEKMIYRYILVNLLYRNRKLLYQYRRTLICSVKTLCCIHCFIMIRNHDYFGN